jgi:hypothetical protein
LLNHSYGDKHVNDQYTNYPAEIANDLVEDAAQVTDTRNNQEDTDTRTDTREVCSGSNSVPGGQESPPGSVLQVPVQPVPSQSVTANEAAASMRICVMSCAAPINTDSSKS